MLKIRNMESERCKIMVKNQLEKIGLQYKTVELGKVLIKENTLGDKLQLLDSALRTIGLELMDDKKNLLIEKIKMHLASNDVFVKPF